MIAAALHALLDTNGGPLGSHYEPLVLELISLAEAWIANCSSKPAWKSVVNSPHRLVHELEDAVVPLQEVLDTCFGGSSPPAEDASTNVEPICIVDLCAGKAFIALALLGLASRWPHVRSKLGSIAIVEKRCPSYEHALELAAEVDIPLVVLPDNIHDDAFLGRLVCGVPNHTLGLVAVHLCGRLSSRAVEIFNLLGARCKFLFLAPCCMPSGVPPRRGQTKVVVQLEELPANELKACTAQDLKNARWEQDRHLCWNCGESGHAKADCAAPASSMAKFKANRTKHIRSTSVIDLLGVGASSDPFGAWVGGLAGVVAPDAKVRRIDVAIGPASAEEEPVKTCKCDRKDWHEGRKGAWVFAMREEITCVIEKGVEALVVG